MAKKTYSKELEGFKEYLRSDSNEDAKRPLLYPLFKKLFGEKFKIESDAHGADVYAEGQIIVESKTRFSQWLEGFYQALHYHKKFGLAYSVIMVIAHKFIGIWKINKIPEYAAILANTADPNVSPNKIGKENARKTQKANRVEIKNSSFYWLEPRELEGDIFADAKNLTTESFEILKILKNLDSNRLQINTHNFIHVIERMKPFFEQPIDAIHAFYSIVNYWDITSTVAENEYSNEISVVGFKGHKISDPVSVLPKYKNDFIKFVENQYVFTNEGSGLTADYYFSRFDEVLATLDPEYAKQHGIFFTDSNLSKFAMWFVQNYFKADLDENYIVFDPAGGSGNLVTSWRGNLKHKIVSELQPDLLRTIEKRMKIDPYHIDSGFTIIPKTSENKGLNFLAISGQEYFDKLENELHEKHLKIDKPIAFLLNPPYKNTKENKSVRVSTESNYLINQNVLEITGNEASKERYLAFLGQILLMCKHKKSIDNLDCLVLIFTPTSWLIPRPNFVKFRDYWDGHFKYENGFIITSNEFFKLKGKWPLAFTIWSYKYKTNGNQNNIVVNDLTYFAKNDLNINWNNRNQSNIYLLKILKKSKLVNFSETKPRIREAFKLEFYDFIRDPTKSERESMQIYGGLPLRDERRKNKKTYGISNSRYVGFLDNGTPCRIKPRGSKKRFCESNLASVWFRLDTAFKDKNKAKCFSGASDTRSYCAYNLNSAKNTFTWFAICKCLDTKYPLWANQYDIWSPKIKKRLERYFYSLCFAFGLSENRCVVTKFEANNPVEGTDEIFVDNPLSTINPESFWNSTLDERIVDKPNKAIRLVNEIKKLYRTWNDNYCQGEIIEHVGLHNEPYFKYFDYPDFLTPNSGLIQIKKHAEQEGLNDLLTIFAEISELTKIVKEEIFNLLVNEFKYFE